METIKTVFEEIKVLGHELADKVKSLIHEGNVRRSSSRTKRGTRSSRSRLPWPRWARCWLPWWLP